ncbi:hypothetical protein SAMN05443667_101259 [Flavobacterium gillisiae]|uniref:Uncharacterized protein n=1 Tax=Flavobacterium gillisiae TaxID=150146 RepID=A0A1H3WVD5_9FLAO|nr:hypothetical protein [Flavobacterium gillisiae]SDZ91116.1 hypothetical protein SAMN05443667_101259 [Flavobacterium gillisiae]
MSTKTLIQPKRKAELQEILKGFGRETVKQEVIKIIMKLRDVPLKEAQNIKTIFPNEVKEIFNRFDYEIEA